MAKKYNLGNVNLQMAMVSILADGGGISEKENWDGFRYAEGVTHVTVYSRKANRHLSFNVDKYGNMSNVHTDMDNNAFYNYKSGR